MFQSSKSKRSSRKSLVDPDDEKDLTSSKHSSRHSKERKHSKVKDFFRRLSLNFEQDTVPRDHPTNLNISPYDNNVDDIAEEIKRSENQTHISSFQVKKKDPPTPSGNFVDIQPSQDEAAGADNQQNIRKDTSRSINARFRARCYSIDSIETDTSLQPDQDTRAQDIPTNGTDVYNYSNPEGEYSTSLRGTADVAGPFIHRVEHQLPPSQAIEAKSEKNLSAHFSFDHSKGDSLTVPCPYENIYIFGTEVTDSDTAIMEREVLQKMKQASLLRGQSLGSVDSMSDDETFLDDSFDAGDSCDDLLVEPSPYANIDFNEDGEGIKTMDKLHHIVYEMMTTEEAYVSRLEILNRAKVESEKLFDKEIANQMFPYIDSIYTLHKDNMLPHIQERVKAWRSNKRIGDIMKRFAPFLKLYTDYVKNFDNSLTNVELWNEKSPEFRNLLTKLQTKGPSTSMKVQIKSHMLEPVQRVPRYELLLKEYLKNLPAESEDRKNTENALESVVEASKQFEQMMKIESKMGQLVELERQMASPVSILSTSRELIKQGKICKVCATTGKVVNRYLFLFNDILLICIEQAFSIPGLYPKYKVRQLMEIDGMQIVDGTNNVVPYTFYVKTRKKAIELCAKDEDEKGSWHQVLWKAVGDRMRSKVNSKNSLSRKKTIRKTFINEESLGKQAPVWIHNTQASQCMMCAVEFRPFRKKHHCRACGCVVCRKCSLRTAKLPYDDMQEHKVCDGCYLILSECPTSPIKRDQHFKRRSQFVCSISGYIQASDDNGRQWERRWLELHEGAVLFCYKAEQDLRPLYSIDLKDCSVALSKGKDNGKILNIEDQHSNNRYSYKDTDNEILKWHDVIQTEKG